MKVTENEVFAVCLFLVCIDVDQANYSLQNYSLQCPERTQWRIRAQHKCNFSYDYHCLYDTNYEENKEFCSSPKDYTAGLAAVYRGNIDADMCPGFRYMPFNFKSNSTENCIFLKSKCSEEGQLVYTNWSLADDVACTCDFTNGYAFVTTPENNCFCVASREDCSCYKKLCKQSSFTLSPDHKCILSKLAKTQTLDDHNFQCYAFPDRIESKKIDTSPSMWDVKSTFIKKQELYFSVKGIVLGVTVTMLVFRILYLICGYLYGNVTTNLNAYSIKFISNNKQHVDSRNKENPEVLLTDDDVKADDYFTINCDHDLNFFKFYNGLELLVNKEIKEEPRILDMCFVKLDGKIHLVYIDADNKIIVNLDISNDSERHYELDREPNRMAKINDALIAIIYKKGFDIMIFDVVKMECTPINYSITQSDIMKSVSGIQGILALSQSKLILSDKTRLYSCDLDVEKKEAKVNDFARSGPEFDTARRLTHVTVSQSKKNKQNLDVVIFIADENDKKLVSFGYNGYKIDEQTGQNRGLQNVRAIGATECKVYAAVSAGISVYCHDKGKFEKQDKQDKRKRNYTMLVEYKKHVEHTRGLCLQCDGDNLHIGLSCIIKEKDVVLLFKFKPGDDIGVN